MPSIKGWLRTEGVEVDQKGKKNGYTPLLVAVACKQKGFKDRRIGKDGEKG